MSNEPKELKFDFCHLHERRPGTFMEALKAVAQIAGSGEARTARLGPENIPHRATHVRIGESDVAMEVRRISTTEPVIVADTRGGERAEDLDDDSGPPRDTAALWIPSHGVLIVERNRSGASAKTVVNYFMAKAELPFEAEPLRILIRDPMTRATELKKFRKFVFTLAGDSAMSGLRNMGLSFGGGMGAMTARSDVRVKIEVSAVRGGEDLDREAVGRVAQTVSGLPSAEGLKIGGRDEHNENLMLDCLEATMFETALVVPVKRVFPFDARVRAMREAYAKRRVELTERMRELRRATP